MQIFVRGTNPTRSNLQCAGMSALLLAALVLECQILRCEWEEKLLFCFPRVLISAANEASESLSYLDLRLGPVWVISKNKPPASHYHTLTLSFSLLHTYAHTKAGVEFQL